MNTKSYHTLSATSLGVTLLLVAALVAIGLGTAPGQMAAARLTLGVNQRRKLNLLLLHAD
ncbi:hypothetical protein ACSSZE_16025 [Acidithiobacillus caldus]